MTGTSFSIDPGVLRVFPDATVLALRVGNLRVAVAQHSGADLLAKAVADCTVDPEKVAEDPVVASWRAAYGLMGVKPSKYRSSVEALLRRASKKGDLAIPVASVNIYNACSIAAKAPLGAYDAGRLPGTNMVLRFARPASDRFDPLGGEARDFPLSEGLVVYATGDDVLCWGFNARDSKLSALQNDTEEGLFFAEAALASQVEAAVMAMTMLHTTFATLGAEVSNLVRADRNSPSVLI
jgi:lysyl-tRNA synthetase class 2